MVASAIPRRRAASQDSAISSETVVSEGRLEDKYVLGKTIGQGAFGVVYSCRTKETSEEFAVKMIDQEETPLAEIEQEVNMLRRLAHPFIVKLHDVIYEEVFAFMVLDLHKGGDLVDGMDLHWKRKGMLAMSVVQHICRMLVQGVAYLHQNNVVHRDIKGDNILLNCKAIDDPNCRIFLGDFGSAVEVQPGERLKEKCGTETHWAPEFYDLNYCTAVDMWAIGVVAYGLVSRHFPFKNEADCRTKPVLCPPQTKKDGESFILATLVKDEANRLTAEQALKHRFLSSRRLRWLGEASLTFNLRSKKMARMLAYGSDVADMLGMFPMRKLGLPHLRP